MNDNLARLTFSFNDGIKNKSEDSFSNLSSRSALIFLFLSWRWIDVCTAQWLPFCIQYFCVGSVYGKCYGLVWILVGWTSQCSVLYPIHIYWCKICCKWILAIEDWWLLPVSLIWHVVIICSHFISSPWATLRIWNTPVMQTVQMPTGQDISQVDQP